MRAYPIPGILSGGDSIPLQPLTINPSTTLYYEQSGITEVSGAVASWDSIGLNTLRLADASDATQRPALATVGGLSVADFDGVNDRLISAVNFTYVKPCLVGIVFRIDVHTQPRRIFDIDTTQLELLLLNTNTIRLEHGAVDLQPANETTPAGAWYRMLIHIADSGGVSWMDVNGVRNVSTIDPEPIQIPAAQVFTLGNVLGGGSAANCKIAELCVMNSFAPTADQRDALDAWQLGVLAALGV